jgi:hypothetical protein
MNLDPYLTPYTKINLKNFTHLCIKTKTLKPSRRCREYLHKPGEGKNFLSRPRKQ